MRFFATKQDLLPVIFDLDSKSHFQYCASGLFDSPDIRYYSSLFFVPQLGVAQRDSTQSSSYLVLGSNKLIQTRAIPQRSGGVKYAIDQLINPNTAVFRLGGIYKAGVLVEGTVGTASKSEYASFTDKLLRKTLAKHFRKLASGCYIGSEAKSLLEQGWRLVQSESQPYEYDEKAK